MANVENEFNREQEVVVKNIAGWNVGFARMNGIGDINITPEGSMMLTRNEIISQVQNGNKLFTGSDGNGSHATLFIDDDATRKKVGFDTAKEKQLMFSDELVTKLFSTKSQAKFEELVSEMIVTRAEKYAVIGAIGRLGINDYSKIRFIEKYTGYSVQ